MSNLPPEEPEVPYLPPEREPLPEAGAVGLFSMLTGGGSEVKFTLRNFTGRELIDAIMDTVTYATTKGWKPYHSGTTPPAGTAAKPAAQPAPAGAAPVVVPPPAAGVAAKPGPVTQAAQAAAAEPQFMHVVKMKVTPKPAGKVYLEWMAAPNHNFADIYATYTLDKALAILAPTGGWLAEHLASPQEYAVDMTIKWKPGKLNTAGNPYKDIIGIAPGA